MKPLVVKIGGSTFGKHDTTIEDLLELQKKCVPVVVVHGGGKTVTDWLSRLKIPTNFINGLRVTNLETLKVVTAVLGGLVNKELVAAIWRLGGKAVGLCGVDGSLIEAKNRTPELGYTAEELKVNAALLKTLLQYGYIPVLAPISLNATKCSDRDTDLLNVNGDTVAGEIAAALNAEKVIFLTDVPGIHDDSNKLINEVRLDEAMWMIDSGVISGGMVAKIEACMMALKIVPMIRIIDGRVPHALLNEIEGKGEGTTIAR